MFTLSLLASSFSTVLTKFPIAARRSFSLAFCASLAAARRDAVASKTDILTPRLATRLRQSLAVNERRIFSSVRRSGEGRLPKAKCARRRSSGGRVESSSVANLTRSSLVLGRLSGLPGAPTCSITLSGADDKDVIPFIEFVSSNDRDSDTIVNPKAAVPCSSNGLSHQTHFLRSATKESRRYKRQHSQVPDYRCRINLGIQVPSDLWPLKFRRSRIVPSLKHCGSNP